MHVRKKVAVVRRALADKVAVFYLLFLEEQVLFGQSQWLDQLQIINDVHVK